MWTCPACGEQHQEQFDACWKCAGRQLPQVRSAPPGPRRSLADVLPQAAVGGLAGTMLGAALFGLLGGVPFPDSLSRGLYVGVPVALLVGTFVWTFFPFRPAEREPPAE
jgi:hypothetical protein